ncbi:Micrococcal nuclease-like protein [Geoglobus ahangari]|uniref:Micrococcal nuclease-like protein n=1 Tax=Geoglobus ahangari TaxID=113653 RepID=A0A0F7DBT7_9EURY|nr:lamin tail domain-containing protein [Geoglobus ahangari]AKG91661.1 Micrococcal nuclease-like protein [Geoglobus ahangari]
MGFYGKLLITFLTLLALTLLGCSQTEESPQLTATPTPTTTSPTPLSTPSQPPSPEQTPIPTPTAEKLSILPGKNYTARVVYVVDGDTIDVLFQDGTKERIRILGIDCPETDASRNRKGEYDGIADTQYLAVWGRKAEERAKELLDGKQVVVQTDDKAEPRDVYGRLLAYVYVNGVDFGAVMIKEGYARCYYEAEFSKRDLYRQLEEEAKQNKIGLWNYSPPVVEILSVNYDACGEVDDRECLNDEYVVIANTGSTSVSLYGWKIQDESGKYYIFPDVVLDPGEQVILHTGKGLDNSTDIFWNSGRAIWNNDHDTAYLYNSEGELVDNYEW